MAEEKKVGVEEGKNEEKGADKSRLIRIIILVVILVCAGAGILGWVKFKKSSDKSSAPDASVSESKQPTEKQSEFGGILSLEPFFVNLNDPGRKRYLKTKIELEMGPGKANEEIKSRLPQLRDLILLHLITKSMGEIQETTGKITLRTELITKINQILKQSKVRTLYFTEFLIQ